MWECPQFVALATCLAFDFIFAEAHGKMREWHLDANGMEGMAMMAMALEKCKTVFICSSDFLHSSKMSIQHSFDSTILGSIKTYAWISIEFSGYWSEHGRRNSSSAPEAWALAVCKHRPVLACQTMQNQDPLGVSFLTCYIMCISHSYLIISPG